jgi:hypothetical protein
MPHDVVSSSKQGLKVTFLVVDHGRARRSASLNTVSTPAPGLNHAKLARLAINDHSQPSQTMGDLAVNLDELSVVVTGSYFHWMMGHDRAHRRVTS